MSPMSPIRRAIPALSLLLSLASPAAIASPPATAAFEKVPLTDPRGLPSEANAVNGAGQAAGNLSVDAWRCNPFLYSRDTGAVDIGTPGPAWNGSAFLLNDAGEAAGDFSMLQYFAYSKPFFYSPENGVIDISPDPSRNASVLGFNNHGQASIVTGEGDAYHFIWDDPRPFLWSPDGGFVDMAPVLGTVFGWPMAVNDAGQVAGWASNDAYSWTPFRYTPGRGVEFLPVLPGASDAYVTRLNRGGDGVGIRFERIDNSSWWPRSGAFWGADGTAIDIGTLGGAESTPLAVNDRREVAGYADTADGRAHAFHWSPEGGMTDIGADLPGASYANAINALGHVVGFYYPNAYPTVADSYDEYRAFFWSNETGVVKIGGPDGDLQVSRADAINDRDEAVGHAVFEPGGPAVAALWRIRPVPAVPACDPEGLARIIRGMVEAGTLARGAGEALCAKLEQLERLLDTGKRIPAANVANAFANQVEALARSARLPDSDAETLLSCVARLAEKREKSCDGKTGGRADGKDSGRR